MIGLQLFSLLFGLPIHAILAFVKPRDLRRCCTVFGGEIASFVTSDVKFQMSVADI